MNIVKGIRSHRVLGVRGVLALATLRMTGFPKTISVKYGAHDVHLRIKTTDISVYREVLLERQYEFPVPFEPRVIVDAGANIGMASVFFANKYAKARIIAIEAEHANFEMLRRNVLPYPQVTPIHAALWDSDGDVSIKNADNPGEWGFTVRPGFGVHSITVPTLMGEFGLTGIDIFKIDIEGAEQEVFSGCDWQDKVRCLMIETHDRLRPGCAYTVNAALPSFSSFDRGEITVFIASSSQS